MYNFDLRPLFYLAIFGAIIAVPLALAAVGGVIYVLYLGVLALLA